MEWNAWEDRNKMLHNTSLTGILSGDLSLDQSLLMKRTLRFNSFSVVVRAALPGDINTVTNSSVSDRKRRFVLV